MAGKAQKKSTTKRRHKDVAATSWIKPNLNLAWKNIELYAKTPAFWFRGFITKYRVLGRSTGSFVIAAPPYFVTQYYQVEKFATDIKTDWPLVSALLDHHVVLGVILAGAWTFLMLALYRAGSALAQEQPNGWADTPVILLRTLDNIVGSKEQRFSKHFKLISATAEPSNSSKVFDLITQPGQQLNELIQGIYSTIDFLLRQQEHSSYSLKVNLAAIDNNQCVKSIHFHYPSNHPVRSSLTALNDPNSAIRNAVRSRKIVVLDSIQVERLRAKPRFVVTDDSRAEENGSLICYPVIYEPLNAVVFVISIHVDEPAAFKSKYARSYNELLKPFALRIKLEYALLALKELTINEHTN